MDLAKAGDEFSDLMLGQDNATRWNSAFLMIDRALKKRANVEKFIENSIYKSANNKTVPVDDWLTHEDWFVLEETHIILKPFNSQTKRLQSRVDATHGAIWEAYPPCGCLLKHNWSVTGLCTCEDVATESEPKSVINRELLDQAGLLL